MRRRLFCKIRKKILGRYFINIALRAKKKRGEKKKRSDERNS